MRAHTQFTIHLSPKTKGGKDKQIKKSGSQDLKRKIKMLFDRQSWLYSKINNSIKCLIFFLCHPLLMSLQSLQQKSVIGCSK